VSRPLSVLLAITDISFLAYWSLAALAQLGVIHIPPEWMYANYTNPDVIAWNWSFLPMDLAFSWFGLRAVAASRRGDPVWRPYAIISLTLTMAAGGMAVSYWALLLEFDPSWFLTNLSLVVWPLFVMPKLLRPAGADGD